MEDNEDDALLLVRHLKKAGVQFAHKRAETLDEVKQAIEAGGISAVISDFKLAGFDGLDVLRLVQSRGLDVPFILVSGVIGDEKAVEAMKAGVHDYVLKGNYTRLVPVLEREMREAAQRRARQEAEAELEEYRRRLEALVRERTAELENVNKALRQSQELFRAVVEGTSDLVYVKDRNGNYLLFNPAAERFTGKNASEVIGRDDAFLFPSDEAKAVVELDREVMAAREVRTCEDVLTGAAGEKAVFQSIKGPLLDADGDVVGLFGASRDVTAIRSAEESVRTSEERFALFMDHLPAAVWIKNLDGRYVYANSEAQRIFSHPLSELRGKTDDELFPPDTARRFKENDRIALSEHGTVQTSEQLLQSNGVEHVSIVTKFAIPGPDSLPVEIAGVAFDITDRMQAEERLRASEEQFRQLAEALPPIVWMTGPDGGIEYMNARWYEFTGADRREPGSIKPVNFLHPDDKDRTLESWSQSLETGQPFYAEYRLRRADGEYRWFLARGVSLRGEEGRIVRWFGTSTDIEEQKKARDCAEAAARAKTDFMANMSHEIRTPMNGILGVTDLLLETGLTDLQRQYVGMVKSSGEALLSVVNDVLDFSKLEAGAMALDSIEFHLRDTVEKAAETLAIRTFQKSLKLTVTVEPDLPSYFTGDPAKLRQVLLNLIGNAVKFTDRGEVSVRVSGERSEGKNRLLRFSVTDTGIGIPKEKQGMLFQSFTQVDASTARSYGGTGLGLAISKRIVDRMGGRIWVESREGEGSTFSFEVELSEAECRPAAEPPVVKELTGLRTLVLDDNETNRLMLQHALSAKGLTVEVTGLGRDAIKMAFDAADSGHPFDLVIIDLHLPDMDGFQVAEKLRERFPVDRLALMMITSDDIPGGARKSRDLGMAAYVVKPVRVSTILEALRRVREVCEVSPREEPPKGSVSSIPYCTHVLVAEDNPINLTVTETILRKAGARVTAATNGREAVDLYTLGRYNIILMDVQMPEMDGYEATRVLRAKGADVPIIGLTAHALAGDRERCLSVGMDDYLPKPVTPEGLREKVGYWVRQRPLPAADTQVLRSELGEDEEIVNLVVATFLENAPGQLVDVERAVEGRDVERLQATAHRLKGALGVVAAESARCLVEELEMSAKSKDLAKADDLLAQLEGEMSRLMESLQTK